MTQDSVMDDFKYIIDYEGVIKHNRYGKLDGYFFEDDEFGSSVCDFFHDTDDEGAIVCIHDGQISLYRLYYNKHKKIGPSVHALLFFESSSKAHYSGYLSDVKFDGTYKDNYPIIQLYVTYFDKKTKMFKRNLLDLEFSVIDELLNEIFWVDMAQFL